MEEKSRPDPERPEDPQLPVLRVQAEMTGPPSPPPPDIIDAEWSEATPALALAARLQALAGNLEGLLNLLEAVTDANLLAEARAICKAYGMDTATLEVIADRIRTLRRQSLGVTRVIDRARKLLVVELTAEEVQDAAAQVVELTRRIAAVDDERKGVAADYREQLKGLDGERTRQIGHYTTGRATRGVDVEYHLDLDTHKVRGVRVDTGEVVIIDGQGRTLALEGALAVRGRVDGDQASVTIDVVDEVAPGASRGQFLAKIPGFSEAEAQAAASALAEKLGTAAAEAEKARHRAALAHARAHWPDGRLRILVLPGRGKGARARDERRLYTPHPSGLNRKQRRRKAAKERALLQAEGEER